MRKLPSGNQIIGIILAVCCTGCAALSFKMADVSFSEPFFNIDFSTLEATPEEISGVLLRERVPETGELIYQGQTVIYARTKNERGLQFKFDTTRTDTFSALDREGVSGRVSESIISNKGGRIHEQMEVTERGEITRFVKGFHKSKVGKFEVVNMKRSPLYPEAVVRIGESWTHEEEIELKLHSMLVKQKAPSRKHVKATNTLKGFTTYGGRRAAVILTESAEKSSEALSVFFKSIDMDIQTQIQQITYLDYERGYVLRQVINTMSHTDVVGTNLSDVGKSQTVTELVEKV